MTLLEQLMRFIMGDSRAPGAMIDVIGLGAPDAELAERNRVRIEAAKQQLGERWVGMPRRRD